MGVFRRCVLPLAPWFGIGYGSSATVESDCQLLDRQKVLRLTAVLRRVVPISSRQVNG